MRKFSLAIAAAATLVTLSAAPAFAESAAEEQQYKLNKIFNSDKATTPKVITRATTYTPRATPRTRAAPRNCHEGAQRRLFGNKPRRGR